MNRCIFVAVVSLLLLTVANSQTTVTRDPAAIAIAGQAFAAMGGPQALIAYKDSVSKGTLTVSAGSKSESIPITIKTKGTNMVRVELQQPEGKKVRILNGGTAAIVRPDGRTRKLLRTNTIAERVPHIPFLSLLSEYQNTHIGVHYVGVSVIDGSQAQVIALSYVPNATVTIAQEYDKTTRCQLFIDTATAMVLRMQYSNFAENHSKNSIPVEVRFSDYRNVGSILVPFNQATYSNSVLESTLVLQSVNFNVGLSDSEFQLPQ